MKRAIFAATVALWAGFLLLGHLAGQQPAQPSGPPPYTTTPPTFPGDTAPATPPPDTRAPAKPLSTKQVQAQIQEKLKTEPELAGRALKAEVNGHAVVLKGSVDTARQHDLALRIAQSYAGERQIVDRIKVRQPSS